jgi:hypothetical protein
VILEKLNNILVKIFRVLCMKPVPCSFDVYNSAFGKMIMYQGFVLLRDIT